MIEALKHLAAVANATIREHIIKPATRSDKWPTARKHWLAEHGECAACGGTKNLQVHHVEPFHLDPAKELDPSNFITMCMGEFECHVRIAHGSSFRAFSPTVRTDAEEVLRNPTERPVIEANAKANRKFTEDAG